MHTSVFNILYSRRLVVAVALLLTSTASARAETDVINPLAAASQSIESLVERVSASVVQVVVTGLQPVNAPGSDTAVGRSRSIGSGFVIDRDGYVMTNAHVIRGAERIDVVVTTPGDESAGGTHLARASIVGVADEWDLALLKIDVNLEPLTLADYDGVRQGQLVFAFGSPDGLRNSVSMGMVSATARQMEADSPLVYIQTDAAINPGNSGGPLVNVKGEVVGIDTFIRSSAGGSDGLGFALPSSLVALAYPQLRTYGHLRRAVIGLATQTVTPLLAEGLGLSSPNGLIVSDVADRSPAADAGVRVGDVLTMVDDQQVDRVSPASLYLHLVSLQAGHPVTLSGTRSGQPVSFVVTPVEAEDSTERVSMLDSQSMAVEQLGILGVPFKDARASGVVVAARLGSVQTGAVPLAVGDIILSVNSQVVSDVDGIREVIQRLRRGQAMVLQVMRGGRLSYLSLMRS